MFYLRNSVDGEAEQIIKSYKCTDANYVADWNALKKRYNNRRLIINFLMDQLFNIPKLNVESIIATRQQLDTFSETVRALAALDLPTDQWDVFLCIFSSPG